MAIHQTGKQSDLEKRLRLLRTQVYGKVPEGTPISSETLTTSDITFLRQDLLKISILAGLSLGTQIILFYLSKNEQVLSFGNKFLSLVFHLKIY